jgi:ATP-binding cassette subfamily F protein 3
MSLLTASELSKAYGAQDVFRGVSLAVHERDRIALVGPNGVGKTTLLRLLAGLDTTDAGAVHRARGLSIGYLPQEVIFSTSKGSQLALSVWDNCLAAFGGLLKLEREMRDLEALMAAEGGSPSVLSRYGEVQEAFERQGGYTYRAELQRVLFGLGFDEPEFDRSLEGLSGGERTRAMLARLLLESPKILLLDEPTNHLDIQAIEWLESWLSDYAGAVLVVSHDRYFLDETVRQIWELTTNGIEVYRGNYSAYTQQREERMVRRQKEFQSQQEFIEREREYIRRNIAGQNTRQAQGRRKRLERFMRDDAIDVLRAGRTVRIDFEAGSRSGDRVIETHDLAVGYADGEGYLFEIPDLLLLRGECAAIMGPNGAGKTTFLKTLMGELEPLRGEIKLGAGVQVGYFAQAHEDLDAGRSALEEILSASPGMPISEARGLLALFLFTGDDVYKRVESLSGGERGRLALAKLSQGGANLLLLDEPTNHLDLPSQEILQSALADFPGTILLVSHDRYLIEALGTQVWAISPNQKRLQVYGQGYSEYLAARAEGSGAKKPAVDRSSRGPGLPSKTQGEGREKALEELHRLEVQITELERSMEDLADEMSSAGADVERVRRLGEQYTLHEKALASALTKWEALARQAGDEG